MLISDRLVKVTFPENQTTSSARFFPVFACSKVGNQMENEIEIKLKQNK